jgi:hypothetical protein
MFLALRCAAPMCLSSAPAAPPGTPSIIASSPDVDAPVTVGPVPDVESWLTG